jgi:hypothetical protein
VHQPLVERFNATASVAFFGMKLPRLAFYANVEDLQADLDAGLLHSHNERPHFG